MPLEILFIPPRRYSLLPFADEMKRDWWSNVILNLQPAKIQWSDSETVHHLGETMAFMWLKETCDVNVCSLHLLFIHLQRSTNFATLHYTITMKVRRDSHIFSGFNHIIITKTKKFHLPDAADWIRVRQIIRSDESGYKTIAKDNSFYSFRRNLLDITTFQ